ncbi:MAG: response regulator [Vicinamibacteria bacterium]|nr:response regulator [Vicinamibacteria bacterium]
MKEDLPQILAVFREEAGNLSEKMSECFERISSLPPERFASEVRILQRLAHNLKGAAASVGYDQIEAIAHAIEDALDLVAEDHSRLTPDMQSTALRSLSAIAGFVAGESGRDELQAALDELQSKGHSSVSPIKQARRNGGPEAAKNDAPNGDVTKGVRVDTGRLNRLMGFSGELLVSQVRMANRMRNLQALARDLDAAALGTSETTNLEELKKRFTVFVRQEHRDLLDFTHLTDELHDAMKHLRMMPLAGLEGTWRRVVRDSARQSGREVQLDCDFGDIELDKEVLDNLRDPMMHILRNAVGHGIEQPEERIARGKPRQGRILISAQARGTMASLEICDDGRGLDLARISEVAVSKGLLTFGDDEALSPYVLAELIFHPSFSTADTVTRQSGRGVGLDVVRGRLERLGGRIEVDAHGRLGGATFRLWTPTSVISTVGFFTRCGDTTFALPVEHVERALRRCKHKVRRIDGKTVLTPDDEEPVRLERLESLLRLQLTPDGGDKKIVILEHRGSRLGIEVDEVVGQREYVVQRLPWNLAGLAGVNGAIIQADGTLAVPVDVPFLFEKARQGAKASASAPDGKPFRHERRILVVDDSPSARTLESSMLLSAGYEVCVAEDGDDAWKRLDREEFDLVVADICMPKFDGFELTRMIRGSPRHHDIPVVLVTNLARPEDRAAGANAGADEYLVKGQFSQRELLDAVAKYL